MFFLILLARSGAGQERAEFEFNVQRQPLQSAVKEIATTGRMNIGIGEKSLKTIPVGPVIGRFGAQEALRRLISGTELDFTLDDVGNYEIVRSSNTGGSPSTKIASTGHTAPHMRGERSVTVVASRIEAIPFTPISVISDSQSIDQLGYVSLGEATADAIGQLHALPEFIWGDGGLYADIRGLGPDATNVTINGRWAPASASSGIAFDQNAIALSAVDRVQLLPDSAAAEQGVRAIGGVIDIGLKRMPTTPIARVEYGGAAGGGAQRQVSLGVGTHGAEFTTSLLLDFFERDELPGEARAFWRNQDFSRFGGPDWRSRASWPGNIASATGATLPGLPATYAAVPQGTAGREPQISDFERTAGQYTLESSRRYTSILPQARRLSVVASAEATLGSVKAFVELIGVRRRADYRFMPPTLDGELVPVTNAHTPFDEPVAAWRLLSEYDSRRINMRSEWLRLVSGFSGGIGSWVWDFSALHSAESASRWANNALDQTRLASALASSDPDTALNVFQDGPVGSPELLASLVVAPETVPLRSDATELSASVSGPLVVMGTGDVKASFGAAWREESTYATRTAWVWHGELSIPLRRDTLDAYVSSRLDHFSDVGQKATSAYALKWQPHASTQVDLSYGTTFRAPSTQELAGLQYEMDVLVADRRRQGELTQVTVAGGSSRRLEAVSGESTALRVKVMPSESLEVEGVYWVKRVDDRIVTLPLSLLIEHEDAFSGHIERYAPAPDDLAAGRPGAIRSIDMSMTNVGEIDASGLDARVAYQFSKKVSAKLSATWIETFDCTQVPGGAPVNRIGVANARGTIPRWHLGGAVYWQNEKASASLSARYVPHYKDAIGDQGTDRQLRSQTRMDLRISLDLDELAPQLEYLHGISISGGVLNVLDTSPQFSAAGQDLGYDPSSAGDPRQRFGYLRIEKQF